MVHEWAQEAPSDVVRDNVLPLYSSTHCTGRTLAKKSTEECDTGKCVAKCYLYTGDKYNIFAHHCVLRTLRVWVCLAGPQWCRALPYAPDIANGTSNNHGSCGPD